VDLCLDLHVDMWKQYPDSIEVGEQVFLCAAAVWDTKVMAESSRKMFNSVKDEMWARLAAWAEWTNVCALLLLFLSLRFCHAAQEDDLHIRKHHNQLPHKHIHRQQPRVHSK
jgi:hypothetical protein